MSYKTEILTDTSGKYQGYAARFQTEGEANAYGHHLGHALPIVGWKVRVMESDDPVTYGWYGGRLVELRKQKAAP